MKPPLSSKQLVQSLVAAINAQDWTALRQIVAADFRRHSIAAGEPGVRSADDLVAFLQAEYLTFPDAHETVEDMVAEGDKVAVRHRFRGTQSGALGPYPPSRRVLESTYLAIYRVCDGRIVEAWAEWDNLSSLQSLGHRGAV